MARAYVVRRPVINSYLVRERDRRRLRELGWVLLVVLPVGLFGLAYVGLRLEVLRVGYRLDGLETQLERYQQEERLLALEHSALTRPAVIERRAMSELGMRVPESHQLLAARPQPAAVLEAGSGPGEAVP